MTVITDFFFFLKSF